MRALILSASFGGGHHQANEALGEALRKSRPQLQVRQTDFLRHLRGYERGVVLGTYLGWLKYSPASYRWYYRFTDRETEPRAIRDTYQWMGRQGLSAELREFGPELVISSYPTPAAVAGHLRQRGALKFLNVLVVTDYRVHQHWIRPEADLTLAPSQEVAGQLIERGLSADKVAVSGIPIRSRYRDLLGADTAALRLKHGLRPDLPLLLVSGGAHGTYRSLNTLLSELANLGRRVQVLVTAGAGAAHTQQLGGATVHSLGFTHDFPELLAAADLVVGKAGGLTVAESAALGVPMVVFDPIPGQEEHNAEYLERGGAAIWARTRAALRPAILRALDASEHARLSAACLRLSAPDAAERAARLILDAWERR